MWHRDTKWANAIEKKKKGAGSLPDAGLPQTFHLLKKKKQCSVFKVQCNEAESNEECPEMFSLAHWL